ncbi:hypothetical protein RhiJN_06571 [Ceratobasidium sp. AG-Ba]|nr:hypothetical protein RhiJN_06571 [Ceratobasidium sp. AG-Ba]
MWGYVLANSEPVSYPIIDGLFHGCILTGRPEFGNKWQMWLFAYVVFDSSVFALVLTKTLRYSRETHSPLIKTLRNDGTAYFIVIFTVNVAWLIMTFKAAEPLKNINEHFSHLVSVVLISRLTIHLRSEGDKHRSQPWQPARPLPSTRGMRHHSNSLSGPPDPAMIASVSTYAGQRWSRSEKGKSRSSDSSVGGGSPSESTTTTLRPSPESTSADLDVEKVAESSRGWRRSSLLRRDNIAPGGENNTREPERAERPMSWVTRMRSRRDTAGTTLNNQTQPQTYVPQTMATWDGTREAGPSPIEAAALSVRQSMDGYAFRTLEQPPPVRLAADYI